MPSVEEEIADQGQAEDQGEGEVKLKIIDDPWEGESEGLKLNDLSGTWYIEEQKSRIKNPRDFKKWYEAVFPDADKIQDWQKSAIQAIDKAGGVPDMTVSVWWTPTRYRQIPRSPLIHYSPGESLSIKPPKEDWRNFLEKRIMALPNTDNVSEFVIGIETPSMVVDLLGGVPPCFTALRLPAIAKHLPCRWGHEYEHFTSPTITLSQGALWLQNSFSFGRDDDIRTPRSLYYPATDEEIEQASEEVESSHLHAGTGTTVGYYEDAKGGRYYFKQYPLLPNTIHPQEKHRRNPSYRITPELAERLHPYLSPFALHRLSVPRDRRDLAPPLDSVNYENPAAGITGVTLATLRNGFLKRLKATLDPHQIESLDYTFTGDDTYIADDAGTGKTITALAAALCQRAKLTLIIGPSSSKYNWAAEIEEKTVGRARTMVVDAGDGNCTEGSIQEFVTASAYDPLPCYVIINYDIVDRVIDTLTSIHWDLLIVDEAKRLQYDDSKRSVLILGGKLGKGKSAKFTRPIAALQRIFMDGTPINKPFHFWPIVKTFDPRGLGADKVEFSKQYCGGYFDTFGKWQWSGATSMAQVQELGRLCRERFMVRHSDAVLNLQPAIEEVIFIEVADPEALATDEQNAIMNALDKLRTQDKELGDQTARELMSEVAKRGGGRDALVDVVGEHFGEQLVNAKARGPFHRIMLEEMASVRRKLGAAKVLPSVKFIVDTWALNDYAPIIVFAHHKEDVVNALYVELGDAMYARLEQDADSGSSRAESLLADVRGQFKGVIAKITGDVNGSKKRDIRNQFQGGALLALVANIAAAGEALTLTRSHCVFFVEADWNATMMRQARKRAERRGQQFPVNVYLLFVNGSFDYTVVSKFLLKREIQDAFFGEGMWAPQTGAAIPDDEDDDG